MNSSSSLRDLYIDPSQAWNFVPPIPAAKSTSELLEGPGHTTPVHQWSMRPSPNSIFDLSPSLDLSESFGINVAQLFKAVVASAILQYTSTAIVMPWEVGKMLLQVQWVPRDAGEPEPLDSEMVEHDRDDAVCMFSSNA
jgi:mitochondrial fusion and transport protein UGO1